MKITHFDDLPVATASYLNAKPASQSTVAGLRGVERTFLPITLGRVTGLPATLQGLVVASDLQGKVKNPRSRQFALLGEVLPEILRRVIEVELGGNPLKFGVLLAGDLFALLEKRGGLGDVIPVWEAFRGEFRWVAGVAGNHDQFGHSPEENRQFRQRSQCHLLEGTSVTVDELRIGGVSGIIGRKGKPNRLPVDTYLQQLTNVLDEKPDICLLHESPAVPEQRAPGKEEIREFLEMGPPTLAVCGHVPWKTPLLELPNGTQVLNSDARAFILLPE
ncbi:MAG: metallophosphoesterase [Bacteroidota bacterium]